jgi:hypothetical protein
LKQASKQASNKLEEPKFIIERVTKSVERTNVKLPPLFGAFAFKKEESRLADLQEDIKTIKCSLNILLSASNLWVYPTFTVYTVYYAPSCKLGRQRFGTQRLYIDNGWITLRWHADRSI